MSIEDDRHFEDSDGQDKRAWLRDQFAMAALTGLVLHPLLETSPWSDVAEASYLVADAMLAAR